MADEKINPYFLSEEENIEQTPTISEGVNPYFTEDSVISASSITPVSPTDEDPSFFETLGQTVDQLQASGWAGVRVMGEAMENETLVEAGNKGVIFNEAQAAKYGRPMIVEDIEDTGDASYTFYCCIFTHSFCRG